MNITRENIDDLNAVLTVKIDKPDYEEKVENVLKDYRKKANIKGFRPGMVPIGLIKKMYGKAVLVDEINKAVTENVQKYLTDEKVEILGDPLPKEDEHERIDFDAQEDFTFRFEVGLSPVIDLNISKDDKVANYHITIDEKMRNDYVSNYRRRFGELRNVEKVEEKDVVKGRIESLGEDGNVKEEGITAEDTSLSVDVIKDEEIKKLFIGKAAGDQVDFDLKKAFPNDYEIAGILKIKRENAGSAEGNFRFTIKEINRFFEAEVNKELFDKIYGEGLVGTEEEFIKKVDEEISANLLKESDYKLMYDLRKLAMDKTEISLPEEFLKKWLLRVNENNTPETIESEFGSFRKDLKWQLIKNKIARDNEVKITEEELLREAENVTRMQFMQYGLYYATDEQISNYAKEYLKREDEAKRIADKILEVKAAGILKEKVTLEEKDITAEEFNKLFESETAEHDSDHEHDDDHIHEHIEE
ncbi:MAG TPA: trigger factor [Bacteroidales bacterium]|nr:trigger factor [Bacteroidales bacterium]